MYPCGTRFSTTVMYKKAFLFNFVANFQYNSMADVVKFCTSDTLVKNVLDNFFFIFIYVEVQIEQIKMIQSFIGLAGLIFEINGKNWQFMTFFAIKTTQRWDHVAYWTLILAQSSFHIHAALRIIGGKVATVK